MTIALLYLVGSVLAFSAVVYLYTLVLRWLFVLGPLALILCLVGPLLMTVPR